jgi:pyruvate/2-oxoacid:ferredoxin oxidoreductase beta subunit
MKKAIKEAIQWPGFAFVDVASQCIENNGRRIGFSSANEMLQNYRTEYKAAPAGATRLETHQTGIIKGEPLPVDAK